MTVSKLTRNLITIHTKDNLNYRGISYCNQAFYRPQPPSSAASMMLSLTDMKLWSRIKRMA